MTVAGRCISAEFTVTEGKGEPLLGRESGSELGVLKFQVPDKPVNRASKKT